MSEEDKAPESDIPPPPPSKKIPAPPATKKIGVASSGTKRIAAPSGTKKIVAGSSSKEKAASPTPSSTKKAAADAGLGLAAFPCSECGKPLPEDMAEGAVCPKCSENLTPTKRRLKTKSRTRAEVGERSGTPSRGGVPAAQHAQNQQTMAMIGGVILVLGIAAIFVLKQGQGGPTEVANNDDTPSPSTSAVKPPRPIPSQAAISNAVEAPKPVEAPKETDEIRKQKLGWQIEDALALYNKRDYVGAQKKLAEVRKAVQPTDLDIIKSLDSIGRDVDLAVRAQASGDTPRSSGSGAASTDPDPPARPDPPEPSKDEPKPATPSVSSFDSMKNYTSLRRMLDPHMAHLELDDADKILGNPPDVAGEQAQNVADDKNAIPALKAILDLAGATITKQGRQEHQFKLWASGKKLNCRVLKVDGIDLTVTQAAGVEQAMKLNEIDPEDLCVLARTGLAAEQRVSYLLGRGLLYYYGGDDPKAKKALAEKELAGNTLAQAFLKRIERDPVRVPPSASGSGGADTPPAPPVGGPPPKVDPGKGDDPASRDLTADLAKLRSRLHVNPSSAGNGMIGLRYSFSDDAQAADFENKGLEMCERNPSNDVVFGGGTGLCLSAGTMGFTTIDVPFKGDFTMQATVQVQAGPGGADLVFFCGLGKGKGTGMTWMGQIVEIASNGAYAVKGGAGVDQTKWKTKATNTLKMVREGTRVTYWFNGLSMGTATFAGGEGKAGIMVADMRAIVRNFEVSGQLGSMKK